MCARPPGFQFFPSCLIKLPKRVEEVVAGLSILSQLLRKLVDAVSGMFYEAHFQFFPSCCRRRTTTLSLLRSPGLSILSQLLPGTVMPRRPSTTATRPAISTFNSFPVAAGKRLIFVSQNLPDFQFFPSCCPWFRQPRSSRPSSSFNSFPVAAGT